MDADADAEEDAVTCNCILIRIRIHEKGPHPAHPRLHAASLLKIGLFDVNYGFLLI